MNIGIFAYHDSQQAHALAALLHNEQNIRCTFFDLSIPPDEKTLISADRIVFAGQRVDTLDIAIVHGYVYDNPVVPKANDRHDFSVWQCEYLSTQQSQSYLFSLFSEMHRRGVELLCSPKTHVLCFEKAHMLAQLKRSGISVPSFVLSNAMDDIVDFVAQYNAVVWRPSTGRASWQMFTDRQRDALVDKSKPPVLVANIAEGSLCRCFALRGKALLTLKTSYPTAVPPERLEVLWECEPSDALQDACRILYEKTGIGLAQIVGIEGQNTFWLYDVDPDPIMDWLPDTQHETLLSRLASALSGNNSVHKQLLEPEERSSLFLRRMLRILFDFEYAKYKK